jgi:hypothetical protein
VSVAIATAEARPAWTRVVPRCADYLDFMMRWQAGEFDDPPPSEAMSLHWHAKLHPPTGTSAGPTASLRGAKASSSSRLPLVVPALAGP